MSVRERLRGALSHLVPQRPARRVILAGLVFAPLAIAAREARADPVFPGAGALGLTPPAGMSVSRRFAGFEHPAGASIILVEMPPEAWDQINGRFTPEALAATGFRVKGGAEPLPVAGGEGFVLRGTQPANGLTYAKWVAVVRGAPGTGLVTVQVPRRRPGRCPPLPSRRPSARSRSGRRRA